MFNCVQNSSYLLQLSVIPQKGLLKIDDGMYEAEEICISEYNWVVTLAACVVSTVGL